jgi:hypothetical protein
VPVRGGGSMAHSILSSITAASPWGWYQKAKVDLGSCT